MTYRTRLEAKRDKMVMDISYIPKAQRDILYEYDALIGQLVALAEALENYSFDLTTKQGWLSPTSAKRALNQFNQWLGEK